jgi:hypothetical protein
MPLPSSSAPAIAVGLLDNDPTLKPCYVLVMCPDVETFAPINAATFSLGADENGAHSRGQAETPLRRTLKQINALPPVPAQLLELAMRGSPTGRCSTSPARPLCGGSSSSTTASSPGQSTRDGDDARARTQR